MRNIFCTFFALIVLSSCSLDLPAELPSMVENPKQVETAAGNILVYFEKSDHGYVIVGMHPLFGREFLVEVVDGKLSREEYGPLLGKRQVKRILRQVFMPSNRSLEKGLL